MTEHKRYGDPQFGNTLDELKVLAPHAQTVDGVTFDGPAHKVGAILTLAAAAGELIAEVEALREVAREFAGYFSSDGQRHWELHAMASGEVTMAAKGL